MNTTTRKEKIQILDNWDPTTWGFTKEFQRSEGNILHTYYELQIAEHTKIHISCSQFPETPEKKVVQCVEVSICDHFELLPHINSRPKMSLLIRSLSGQPYTAFKK